MIGYILLITIKFKTGSSIIEMIELNIGEIDTTLTRQEYIQ